MERTKKSPDGENGAEFWKIENGTFHSSHDLGRNLNQTRHPKSISVNGVSINLIF
ncbi:MAG: hypothetical protein WCJ61_06105 [Paludibacter sp.]